MLKLNLSSLKHMKEVNRIHVKPNTVYLLVRDDKDVAIVQTSAAEYEDYVKMVCYSNQWLDDNTMAQPFASEGLWIPDSIEDALCKDTKIYETGINQNILRNLELEILKHLHIVEDV